MENIMVQIEKTGVIPVVVINDVEDAEPLAQALCEGGLPCAEVTFRTAAAEESIRKMTDIYPNMLIGAGTYEPERHRKSNQRNIETVAETDEASSLVTGVDIEHTGKVSGLVGNV